jgi:hypothetical protein
MSLGSTPKTDLKLQAAAELFHKKCLNASFGHLAIGNAKSECQHAKDGYIKALTMSPTFDMNSFARDDAITNTNSYFNKCIGIPKYRHLIPVSNRECVAAADIMKRQLAHKANM